MKYIGAVMSVLAEDDESSCSVGTCYTPAFGIYGTCVCPHFNGIKQVHGKFFINCRKEAK